MRIHVVAQRINADRILPRMARYLGTGNGWTVSESPDHSADANYFFNYLLWQQRAHGWHETPVAGFFTHRDEANQLKAEYWDICAEGMDLRVVCADQYAKLLRPFGMTVLVKPPVELRRFGIKPHSVPARPVVGISGFTYGDNRKGENLVAGLAQSELAKRLDLRASGRGWPVPTKSYRWDAMPGFYQGLDVLLVPSIWEGIHMPTLEALACGIKVVLPRGVGILDELPETSGIYRYKRGHLPSLLGAVEEAVFSGPVDRERLREVSLPFSVQAWCSDHVAAFDQLIAGVPEVEVDLPDWTDCAGAYIVAFGQPSRVCAARLIESLKEHMPDLPVCLCSDWPMGPEDCFVEFADADIGGRKAKLAVDDNAPAAWQYVLYLDADTEVVGDLSHLFQILQDGWELVLCKDMHKYDSVKMMLRPDNRDEAEVTWDELGTDQALQYNGGMMAYRRNERTTAFFLRWQAEWERWGKRDQGALLRALHSDPLRLFVLGNQWNASTRYPLPRGKIALLHHNTEARRWSGLIKGRLDSREAWKMVQRWGGQQTD